MPAVGTFDKVSRVRPAQGTSGAFNQEDYTVAASQTIYRGDIVSLSSGQVQQSIALPGSNNSGTASGGNLPILGVAMANITTNSAGVEATTGRTTIPVAVFDGNLEWGGRIYASPASGATQASLTLGTSYQFQRWRGANSSQWWYSLITTTTNGELRYCANSADSQSSDQYGLVYTRAIQSDTVRQG